MDTIENSAIMRFAVGTKWGHDGDKHHEKPSKVTRSYENLPTTKPHKYRV